MRRIAMIALLVMAFGGAGGFMAGDASARQIAVPLPDSSHLMQPVQYYGAPYHYRDRWERRHHRRARDEARIAEAARREAWRIERERAHRRAWRHAQRQHYGYYRGY